MTRFFPALAPLSAAEARPGSAEDPLIARAQHEDGRAFRVLFDLHAPAVHRFLKDLLGDAAAADEATQETFVRAYHRLRRLRQGDRFRPWVLGIARNVFREHHRRRRQQVSLFVPLEPPPGEPHAPAEEHALDAPTPESTLLVREATSQLSRALQRLSEDRRAALLLRFDHGLSCAEVAEILGWSVAKVKVEVHRARHHLREALAEFEEDRR